MEKILAKFIRKDGFVLEKEMNEIIPNVSFVDMPPIRAMFKDKAIYSGSIINKRDFIVTNIERIIHVEYKEI